jgi:transcriptional regulator with XRE-family HTH domain
MPECHVSHEKPIPTLIRKMIARFWGGKATALASELGVAQSTVSRWASGERDIDAHDLRRILTAAALACPQDAAVVGAWVVEAFVSEGLQVVALAPDLTPRSWEREVVEGMSAEHRMHVARLDGDTEAYDAAAEDVERETRERIVAGRQSMTASAEGALRVVPR